MSGLREVDLELGRPTVAQALDRLRRELKTSRELRCTAVKLIHGYGSSGPGGKIRTAVRRELAALKAVGRIRDVIPGEKFTIFETATLAAFARCDALRRDEDLERYNNGITVVIL